MCKKSAFCTYVYEHGIVIISLLGVFWIFVFLSFFLRLPFFYFSFLCLFSPAILRISSLYLFFSFFLFRFISSPGNLSGMLAGVSSAFSDPVRWDCTEAV